MKKKNSTGIQLLDPTAYWERKLNMNYDTEFIRYKKLCAKLTKKEVQKLDGLYYITYNDWKDQMVNTINLLDYSELYEYIHFLNSLSRKSDTITKITFQFIFPFAISLLGPFFLQLINESVKTYNIAVIITAIVILFCFYRSIRKLILDSKDDSLRCSFYADIMYLAKRQYETFKDF